MRQPYETLLGPYRNHWLIGPYLHGEVPDFDGILTEPRWPSLSDGEQLLVRSALSFWNGGGDVLLADLARLDSANRATVAMALLMTA